MVEAKKIRILYVEDEPDIREIANMALQDLSGFCVKSCSDGKEALAVAEEFNPDLFLLDVMMPGMDGPTTLQKLRNNPKLKSIPAIFMTARVQPHEIKEYHGLGVIGVITKPFDPITLAETIQKKLDESTK